ncbi:hypothetical protein [Cytophaga aurantiaca]|uniref:hypothetical protein n=1 Tax=Cytophaga aurantiaca TaxID=29530 RepID=UPI0003657B68|nr:hypothetical protein [Cytophaga aurantiaca]
MKKLVSILVTAFIAILISSYTSTTLPIELIQAIQAKKISVVVVSTGGHSGKCIELEIKNLTNVPYTLTVAAGTVFIPEDEGEQTLVVPQKNVFVLQPAENKSIAVGGYCTELSDRCPQTSSTFTIAKNTNQSLTDLIQFMTPLRNLDESLIQQSIWCITDEQSPSNVTSDNAANAKVLRDFLFKRTGQADTWYTTKRTPEIAPDRSIINNAIEVTGKIDIKATKPMELIGVVKNEAGEVVWTYPYKTSLPAGDIVFDFGVKVRNWKKGNYFIIYTCEGVELVNQKFTI